MCKKSVCIKHCRKDISLLGRSLSKVIIVDNLYDSFMDQPANGILIKSWYDDMQDEELTVLQYFLKDLAL